MSKNSINSLERRIDRNGRKSPEHGQETESKEILEKTQPLGEGAIDVVSGIESGEVSEKVKEGKKKAPTGQIATGIGDDGSAVAAVMQATFPKVDVMRIQISTKIKKEIAALEKEVKRIKRTPGKLPAFKMNTIIGRIRKLRDILDSLLHATEETIKNLWQKFLKGRA